MRIRFLTVAILLATTFAGRVSAEEAAKAGPVVLVKPTPDQVAWQDMEIGLFIHFNIFTYHPWINTYPKSRADLPSPDLFDPEHLDTDQWIEAAKAIGAKYAVLTAKHGEGFCLWPTEAYDYGVKQAKWLRGQGDVVAAFVKSCRKYGIEPGIYCAVNCNVYMDVLEGGRVKSGDHADQVRYRGICEQQLSELWGRYGPLGEVWFDGGALSPDKGGVNLEPLLRRYQPHAMVFQSPQATIRWVGNENGVAPYPCWATAATPEPVGGGDPNGSFWRPGECDVPLRANEWGWKPAQEHLVRSLNDLMSIYYNSVGRNCNLLLNSTPDRDGLIPKADMARYREFGAEVQRRFGHSLAETSGQGNTLELVLPQKTRIDHVILQEEIAQGERVREYVVEGLVDGQWRELANGSCIGHKRIEQFKPADVTTVRLRVTKSVAAPLIRKMAVYRTE
ncbi:MAG: alpha-L-fucosidase [Candidatus Omnitrophica bacterium]|nr:alpha-L-fucosidase [Candidatus Omnitrophota bacterium]